VISHKSDKEPRKPKSEKMDILQECLQVSREQARIIDELLEVIRHANEDITRGEISDALRRRLVNAPKFVKESAVLRAWDARRDSSPHDMPLTPESFPGRAIGTNIGEDEDDPAQWALRNMLNSRLPCPPQLSRKRKRTESTNDSSMTNSLDQTPGANTTHHHTSTPNQKTMSRNAFSNTVPQFGAQAMNTSSVPQEPLAPSRNSPSTMLNNTDVVGPGYTSGQTPPLPYFAASQYVSYTPGSFASEMTGATAYSFPAPYPSYQNNQHEGALPHHMMTGQHPLVGDLNFQQNLLELSNALHQPFHFHIPTGSSDQISYITDKQYPDPNMSSFFSDAIWDPDAHQDSTS